MFDFIPAKEYSDVYMNLALGLVLFTILHSYVLKLYDSKNISFINVTGYLLLVFLILYIGTRPINGVFGDTVNYNKAFEKYMLGAPIDDNESDYGWHVFMKFLSHFMNVHAFFTICAFLYIYPLYKISINLFNEYWYYAFVMFVVSFSFFTYGVNGVRNGAALSIFLWGLCYREKKIVMAFFFLISTLFHKTALLPIIAYVATYFYNNPKVYLKAWLICIPLSLIMGSVFIVLFTSLGFGDDRLNAYLTTTEANTFASTGFRWDFLFYSAFAVFAGWYFIYKKKYEDKFYYQLLSTYLICNGFWILVIKANYSNRFAYLSWFMMGLVIIYPMLKQTFFKYQYVVIGNVIFLYFGFTYFMEYIYYTYIR